MKLKKLVEEVEFKEEIKVLNKLIVETIKSLVEKEYEIKLDENVSACANLVRGTDDVTLSNALNTLSKEKLALDQGQSPEKNYSAVLTKSGSSLISCIEDIKANLGAKKCDVTVNDPEVKKNFVEFITSKIN